jgi:TPR repeat protein
MSNLMVHVRSAAEGGDANAQFNLGVLCGNGLDDNGRVVGGNRLEAITWLRKAANQGLTRAQCKLAEIYAEGETQGDLERACAWFLVALENGDGGGRQAARDGHEKIVRKLTAEQIARATDRALAWTLKIQIESDKRDLAINAQLKLRA